MSGLALLADIGGTNARFATCRAGERPGEAVLRTGADFPNLDDAVADALIETGAVEEAVLAVAGPVQHGVADLSNSPWRADAEALCRRFGWRRCRLVNDFEANAMALPLLRSGEYEAIGGGRIQTDRPKVVLGPGTGLGVAGLVPADGRWTAVPGEGGHVGLAAGDDGEAALIAVLRHRLGRVSQEDVLSGPGLVNLYFAMIELAGPDAAAGRAVAGPADVTQLALDDPNSPAGRAVTVFSRLLGAYAGDLALIYGAHGGVYLTGGVLPALGALFDRRAFRDRFQAKGRFADYLATIPTLLVTAAQPGLLGLSTLLR